MHLYNNLLCSKFTPSIYLLSYLLHTQCLNIVQSDWLAQIWLICQNKVRCSELEPGMMLWYFMIQHIKLFCKKPGKKAGLTLSGWRGERSKTFFQTVKLRHLFLVWTKPWNSNMCLSNEDQGSVNQNIAKRLCEKLFKNILLEAASVFGQLVAGLRSWLVCAGELQWTGIKECHGSVRWEKEHTGSGCAGPFNSFSPGGMGPMLTPKVCSLIKEHMAPLGKP